MNVVHCLGLLIFLVADSGVRQYLWEPPDALKPLNPLPKASVSREFITRLGVANTNIVLEKTAMRHVQARLGATIGHRGDAGGSLSWLCVSGMDSAGRWVLWLESSEIHGPSIGAFELHRVGRLAQVDDRCSVLAQGSQRVRLPVPLQLGAEEAQVVKILGHPTIKQGDTLFYVHEHQGSARRQPYSASNVLAVVIRSGAVEAIRVWKMTVS